MKAKSYCAECWGCMPRELAIKGKDHKRRHAICHQKRYDELRCAVCKQQINIATDSYKRDFVTGVICHIKCHSALLLYSMVA